MYNKKRKDSTTFRRMKKILLFIMYFLISATFNLACTSKSLNNAKSEENTYRDNNNENLMERYDSVFDVHGPVKSISFTLETKEEIYDLNYAISKVEYLPHGPIWNVIGNKNLRLKYFMIDENSNLNCQFVTADFEELGVNITYNYNPQTHRFDERVCQYDPEGEGCVLHYLYDKNGDITSAEFISYVLNYEMTGYDECKKVYKVDDGDKDQYGNWTQRTLSNEKESITINRDIDYYNEKEIVRNVMVFQGDSIHDNEAVGDFNGDGIWEKSWVNLADIGDDDPRFAEYVELKLSFTDSKIESANLGEGYGFSLFNIGDINGDGCDDIGMMPSPAVSYFNSFHVWVSDKGVNWHQLLSWPIYTETLCNEHGSNFIPVRRSDSGIIEYYSIDEESSDPLDLYTHHICQFKIKD